jgi:predicted AAA+ superfamily ATPase
MIERELSAKITSKLGKDKAIVIFGPRQAGKTTLLKNLFLDQKAVLWLNGDESEVRAAFASASASSLASVIGKNKVVIIDEAQRIEDVGLKLKIIQDNFGDKIQLIATGSSAFELANKINEPLTGRKWEYKLLPLSFGEMVRHHGLVEEKANLNNRLLYGYYPDIASHLGDARERLALLVSDNLYKDVLRLEEIKKSTKLEKLLQALAFQIGSQVSVNELSRLVGVDNKTVDKYLRLLEQSFVIFRLPSFARNLRQELAASNKFYFYDLGVRNGVIDDFRPVALRQDIGGMFENFIIAELQKNRFPGRQYFWRTSQQQEVDYIFEKDGAIGALEIKWNPRRTPRLPKTFVEQYQPATVYFLNHENFADIIGDFGKG